MLTLIYTERKRRSQETLLSIPQPRHESQPSFTPSILIPLFLASLQLFLLNLRQDRTQWNLVQGDDLGSFI